MSLYDLQWRQYETQIATRSAEQSECLKKTALLITGPQTTKSPAQVGACNVMSVCCQGDWQRMLLPIMSLAVCLYRFWEVLRLMKPHQFTVGMDLLSGSR